MTDIGILGLDTSHGEAFAEVLAGMADREPAPTIGAVWDGGAVRSAEYVASFCSTYGAARVDDPAAMVGRVDAALVLAVDWDRHRPLARPFLEAGVPVLIDKPIAGTVADLDALERAAGGTPLFGGSALPLHPAFPALPRGATARTLHLGGYHDDFYYRVHLVDAARRLANADWVAVEPLPVTDTATVGVTFADGTWATLRFDGSTEEPVFAALDVADRTRTAAVDASEAALRAMYEPYLGRFLDVVDGEAEPASGAVLDAARLLLGVQAAFAADRRVATGDPRLADVAVPSEPFVADYEPYY